MELNGIKDLMRKRLSEQHRGMNILGSIALNEVKSYFNIKKFDSEINNEIITGYIRANKLFLKTYDQQIKIRIFKEKGQIIAIINEKILELGYTKTIQDIILK